MSRLFKSLALITLLCGGFAAAAALFAANSNARTFHVGTFTLTCDQGGTLSFNDFPNLNNNTVSWTANVDGFTKSGTFKFNGSTGSFGIPLNINGGTHTVSVTASWNTNGESGTFDSGAITKDCSVPCVPTTVTITTTTPPVTVTQTVPVTTTVHDTVTAVQHNDTVSTSTVTVPVTTTVVNNHTDTVVQNRTDTVTLPAVTTTMPAVTTTNTVVKTHTVVRNHTKTKIVYRTPKKFRIIMRCAKGFGVWYFIGNYCGAPANG